MRNIFLTIAAIASIIMMQSCMKDFLQMPTSSASTVDSVFSTKIKAQGAISNAYRRTMPQGLPWANTWNGMIHENLSGALSVGFSWTLSRGIILNGMNANGIITDMDGYNANFAPIRQCYQVIQNIDKVKDMTDEEKGQTKGEMRALIAYRYSQMMIMYGGVPIVSRVFEGTEEAEMALPRAPVRAVLDSIVKWSDEAIKLLPSVWPEPFRGRMTKSAAMAIKAKALLYAARPLFNSATPYLDFGANNKLISLGSYNAELWSQAAAAAEALITEAETNGNHRIINTGNPLDDYGNATSLPSNPEVILAYKFINTSGATDNWGELPMNAFYNSRYWQGQGNVLMSHQAEQYYKQDGTDQVWPATGVFRPFTEYTQKVNQMEARFKASFQAWEMDAWTNPGDPNWRNNRTFGSGPGYGVARNAKFYYKAGGRRWFEFPIFRLAAAYLTAAEALNEAGQATPALARLNVIRRRAGLPNATETDKVKLRAIIQREWRIEMFSENTRLYDLKHWKHPDIGNGIIGGNIRSFAFNDLTNVKLTANTNYTNRVVYIGYWAPSQFLNPFPQSEVNKGYLVQNPGY